MIRNSLLVTGIISASLLMGVGGTAMASPANPEGTTSASAQQIMDAENAVVSNTDPTKSSFGAIVYATDENGATPVSVTSSTESLGTALSDAGLSVSDFRSDKNTALDANRTFKDGDKIIIFANSVSSTTSTVTIAAPTTQTQTDELYVGETKVESEGKDGEAIQTVVSTSNLSANSDVNKDAASVSGTNKSTSENLTVVIAPEAKVVLVGTKERPVEIATPEASKDATDSATSDPEAIGSASSTKGSTSTTTDDATGSATQADETDGEKAADIAKDQLGKTYVWGSAGPDEFDCSGLIFYAYHTELGYDDLPRTAWDIGTSGTQISDPADIQIGDVVYTTYHIGIYVGGGKVVHAANPSAGVRTDDLSDFINSGYKVARLTND